MLTFSITKYQILVFVLLFDYFLAVLCAAVCTACHICTYFSSCLLLYNVYVIIHAFSDFPSFVSGPLTPFLGQALWIKIYLRTL